MRGGGGVAGFFAAEMECLEVGQSDKRKKLEEKKTKNIKQRIFEKKRIGRNLRRSLRLVLLFRVRCHRV